MLHFETILNSVAPTFFTVMWRGGFVYVSQWRHTKKDNLLKSVVSGGWREGRTIFWLTMENDGDLTPHTVIPSEAQQRAEERKRLLRSTSAPPSQHWVHCAGGCPWSREGLERDGYGLCHLRVKGLTLTRKKQSSPPKWIIQNPGCQWLSSCVSFRPWENLLWQPFCTPQFPNSSFSFNVILLNFLRKIHHTWQE